MMHVTNVAKPMMSVSLSRVLGINKIKSIFNCAVEFEAANQCLMNVRTSIGLVSGTLKRRKMTSPYNCGVPNFKLEFASLLKIA